MSWDSLLLIATISSLAAAQSGRVDSLPSNNTSGAVSASPATVTLPPIIVTARMMGYYRLPDRQPLQLKDTEPPCPAEPKKNLSPEAVNFFEFLDNKYPQRSDILLVGTGDNFSPNYFSRAFANVPANSTQPEGRLAGKEFFEWYPGDKKNKVEQQWVRYDSDLAKKVPGLHEGTATIGTDNVACFFSYAGYAALVPGPEDFYFGPERLRTLARFMAGIKQNLYHPVQMLGANLAIKTSWATDHKPLADELKPRLPFLTRYIGPKANYSIKVQNFTDAGGVYPWLRKIKIKFEPARDDWPTDHTGAQFQPKLCRAELTDPDDLIDPKSQDCKNKIELEEVKKEPQTYKKPSKRIKSEEVEYRIPLEGPLEPGANYAICIPDPTQVKGARMYCTRFFVYKPFFQTPAAVSAELKQKTGSNQGAAACDRLSPKPGTPAYTNPDPYAMTTIGATDVAIFGVVDPNLATRIGGLNFSWQTMKPNPNAAETASRFSTDVVVTDPLKALDQMQQCFTEKHPSFHGLKVLLAHMPPAEAMQLAASLPENLHFDLVVSQGDDLLATPAQKITVKKTNTSFLEKPLVLVPATHSSSAIPTNPVSEISSSAGKDAEETLTIEAPSSTKRPDPQCSRSPFWNVVNRAIPGGYAGPAKTPEDVEEACEVQEDALKALTLYSMQKNGDADLALLQARDFYSGALDDYLSERCGSECSLLDLQEILDRWIWKGDALIVRSVTGATLQSVLEQSKKYADQEKTVNNVGNLSGRALVYVGVHHDEVRDTWIVNTAPLDKNKLYTVAMSDYIALGDTGYPDLAKPPFGDPPRQILSTRRFQTISGAVCQNMMEAAKNEPKIAVQCAPEIHPERYYDSLQDTPSDPRDGKTVWAALQLWSYFHGKRGEQLTPDQKRVAKDIVRRDIVGKTDERVQERPTWQFSLDKLAIGFSGLWHVEDEKTVQQNFGGIRNTQVTAKRFHSWDTEINDQFTRFRTNEDWFMSSSLRYSAKFTANSSPPRSTDQPFDLFSSDAGSYLHLLPFGKQLPQLQWLNSAHFETQPFTPYATVNINALTANGSSSTLTFVPDRSFLVLGRTGPRWQDRKSYIELGGEAGSNLDAITRFDLVNPDGTVIPCPLTAKQSLKKCVDNFNQSNPLNPITPNTTVFTRVATRPRYGIFWNSQVKVPFRPQLDYEMKNTGDYFFNSSGDNSTDSRFRHTLDQTVKFSVFPNLSFEPTYTIFLFENKVDYHFLFQQQFAIKINYAFVWNNNRDKKQQWGYKAPSDGK